MSLLVVDHASQRFGNLRAVTDVSMTVEAGELRAVIGPNGAGKTTFFNLISGFFRPSDGRIFFDGRDVTGLAPHRRVAMGMARTFQITEIFPELSVRDNVRIPVEIAAGYRLAPWVSRRAAHTHRERIDELLALAGLGVRADRLAGELSLGDQRATEIVMSLALQPKLLLLDEPTAGMGDQETYEVTQLIRSLHREQSLTMLLIEHDMRVVFQLAQRIMVLSEGRVLADGTPDEIAGDEAVQAAYLGSAR